MTEPAESKFHIDRHDWLYTSDGRPRVGVQLATLNELWFHTGSSCNLSCRFCFEGSDPENNRVEPLVLADAKPFIDDALALGVRQFSFTGGEPFENENIIEILRYALDYRPCFLLTNGTAPLRRKMDYILLLLRKNHPLTFCVSLDFPDAKAHDEARGDGNFRKALSTLFHLYKAGFGIAVARQMRVDEPKSVELKYRGIFHNVDLPEDIPIIALPELHRPSAPLPVPDITENDVPSTDSRKDQFRPMCSYSRVIVKMEGRASVYACPLVDDDTDYDLGDNLSEALKFHVMLRHHRCQTCLANRLTLSLLNK